MQLSKIAITVAVVIILFEVLPVKSVLSIPVRQADEHMIAAVPGSGGFSFLLMQKGSIQDSNDGNDDNKKIEVYTANDPVVALSEFKPNSDNSWLTSICHI